MHFAVITDLDGTLLEHDTYSFEPARGALETLRQRRIPVILCTSKTRAESVWWRLRLGVTGPFIVENGGAIYWDDSISTHLGVPYPILLEALGCAAAQAACPVRGFAQMTDHEVAERCSLPLEQAVLARKREFDEPFVVADPSRVPALVLAIESAGLRCTRGGRFWHILGPNDKAAAVRRLLAKLGQGTPVTSIGLGDGLNDTGFLNVVDHPVLMPSASLSELQRLVPKGRVAPEAGPAGWAGAVLPLISTSTDD